MALEWCGCSVTRKARACSVSTFTLSGVCAMRVTAANHANLVMQANYHCPGGAASRRHRAVGSRIEAGEPMKCLLVSEPTIWAPPTYSDSGPSSRLHFVGAVRTQPSQDGRAGVIKRDAAVRAHAVCR